MTDTAGTCSFDLVWPSSQSASSRTVVFEVRAGSETGPLVRTFRKTFTDGITAFNFEIHTPVLHTAVVEFTDSTSGAPVPGLVVDVLDTSG